MQHPALSPPTCQIGRRVTHAYRGAGSLLGWKLAGERHGDTSGGLVSDGYVRVDFDLGGPYNVSMATCTIVNLTDEQLLLGSLQALHAAAGGATAELVFQFKGDEAWIDYEHSEQQALRQVCAASDSHSWLLLLPSFQILTGGWGVERANWEIVFCVCVCVAGAERDLHLSPSPRPPVSANIRNLKNKNSSRVIEVE